MKARTTPREARWASPRGFAAEMRRLNRLYRLVGGRRRQIIALPISLHEGTVRPATPEDRPAMPTVDRRPPYWTGLEDCIKDVLALDATLRATNRTAKLHVWLPMP